MGLLDKAEQALSQGEPPSLLKKAESILKSESEPWIESPEAEEEITDIPDDLPDPDFEEEIDIFENWEKEAEEEAIETPISPESQDPIPEESDYLFDDDQDQSTAPIEYHLASKRRIENYQALFEITKEISASKSVVDFVENALFSIMGQIGTSSVVCFLGIDSQNKWEAVESHGIESQMDWILYDSDPTFQRILESETVLYSEELLNGGITPREREIIEGTACRIAIPIQYKGNCFGFFALGKLIHDEDYLADDLEFLKILGEISGSVFSRVESYDKLTVEYENLMILQQTNDSLIQVAKAFANVRKMDEAYDLLVDQLKLKLGVKQFTFLTLDPEGREDYLGFGSNFLLPERFQTLRLNKNSDLVGMISNVPGVYKLEDFAQDPEMKANFSNDELGIMSDCYLLPVINLNWVIGILMVHSLGREWSTRDRDTATTLLEMAAPTLANLLILSEKEALYRNPFNPLESRIREELKISDSNNQSFTVCLYKIQNIARITHILGNASFARFADNLRKSIVDHLGEMDFFTRVGQGKFAIVLHGKDREESEIVNKKIKAAFAKREEGMIYSFRPSFRILTLSYPKDTKDQNQFLEMIEEA